jgi:hypothetical protein
LPDQFCDCPGDVLDRQIDAIGFEPEEHSLRRAKNMLGTAVTLVFVSSLLPAMTSSKAKLSKTSMSSGSVPFSVDL